MKQYEKTRYPGEEATQGLFATGEVYVQEKYDGSNFRFTYNQDTDEIEFGSRRTEGESLQREQFRSIIEYIKEHVDRNALADFDADLGGAVFFGEGMNPHTLTYDWEEMPEFIGFDVWNESTGTFVHPKTAEKAFDMLGLPHARTIEVVDLDNFEPGDYDFDVPVSEYSPDGEELKAEGLMFKNPETNTYAKYVREEFKEKNKETFGPSSKKSLSDTEKFAYEYITEQRIRDTAHDLVDETEWGLEMSMMEDLPKAVIEDFAEEEAANLFINESYEVDIGEFRSIISSRCASVLQHMIDQKTKEQLGMQ